MSADDTTRAEGAVFRVDIHEDGDDVRVQPSGELDIATVPQLDARLHKARGGGPSALVLDLSNLSFIDSSGLRLVVAWSNRARDERFKLVAIRGGPEIDRVFELTGLYDSVPFR
jgi:anti-anti-sigma factor